MRKPLFLKPCPLCGSQNATVEYQSKHYVTVICRNCCCSTGGYSYKRTAVRRWNKRVYSGFVRVNKTTGQMKKLKPSQKDKWIDSNA